MTFKGWPADALTFYAQLDAHNERAWWQEHKTTYDESVKQPFLDLSDLVKKEFGPLRVFRPYRDTRFAKDKTPYKTTAAAVTEGSGGTHYYVQISAEGLYVGSGYYHLMPDQLERYRAAVADNRKGPRLATAIATLRKQYNVDSRDALKRVPRGYEADHPRADLLKLKGVHVGKEFGAPKWLHTAGALDRIVTTWRAGKPVNSWFDRNVGPSSEAPPEPF
jgi:uncharacterized protein (TIGR02453 family)